MSAYELNRFLFDLKMNDDLVAEVDHSRSVVLRRYELSDAEIEAIERQDPRKLRDLGAHGMLALYVLRNHEDFRTNIYWSQK